MIETRIIRHSVSTIFFILVIFLMNDISIGSNLPPSLEAQKQAIAAKKYYQKEEYDKAEDAFRKLMNMSISLPDNMHFYYGKTLYLNGKHYEAKRILEAFLNKSGSDKKYYKESKEALSILVDIDDAIEEEEKRKVENIQRANKYIKELVGLLNVKYEDSWEYEVGADDDPCELDFYYTLFAKIPDSKKPFKILIGSENVYWYYKRVTHYFGPREVMEKEGNKVKHFTVPKGYPSLIQSNRGREYNLKYPLNVKGPEEMRCGRSGKDRGSFCDSAPDLPYALKIGSGTIVGKRSELEKVKELISDIYPLVKAE